MIWSSWTALVLFWMVIGYDKLFCDSDLPDANGNREEKLRLVASTASPTSASWSPDGTRIVASCGSVAIVFDVATGLELIRLASHQSFLVDATFSPAGDLVITASTDHTARVWDAHTGVLLHTLEGHTSWLTSAIFSQDGQRIATTGEDGIACIWESMTGRLMHEMKSDADWLSPASFSPDGRWIVAGMSSGNAQVWDAATGELLRRLEGHADGVRSASFSHDGEQIVTSSEDGTARVWDTEAGMLLHTLIGHTGTVYSSAFSPDGKRIVTASEDGISILWDSGTGGLLQTLTGHQDAIHFASFSPNGELIVTAGADGTLRVWETSAGRLLHTLEGHVEAVHSASFSPHGDRIVTTGEDGRLRLWESKTGDLLYMRDGQASLINAASVSPNGQQIIAASSDNATRVWSMKTGRLDHILRNKEEPVTSGFSPNNILGLRSGVLDASFSPDGQRIVTASRDGTAQLWDTETWDLMHTMTGHVNSVYAGCFSLDGQLIVTASGDRTARVWEAESGKLLYILAGQDDTVFPFWSDFFGPRPGVLSASFSNDGQRILTSHSDRTARVWDSRTGVAAYTLGGHTDWVSSASFSPDGKQIVTTSNDHTGRIWDAGAGLLVRELDGHTDGVSSASFSPDGRQIVTASSDTTLIIWDAVSGVHVRTLQAHAGRVVTSRFSPDGQSIVSTSSDRTSRVWDVETGLLLYTLHSDADPGVPASFSPDGERVLTVSDDGAMRVWHFASGRELAQLLNFADGSWAVIEPGTGRYDAGPTGQSTGECAGLHWVLDSKTVIELEQLKDRYWDPGLLAKIMGHNPEPLREVPPLDKIAAFPSIKVDKNPTSAWRPVEIDGKTLTLDLTNDGGGIGAVEVTVDGKPVSTDLRPRSADPDSAAMSLSLDLAATGMLRPGHPNRVEVRAWNKDRTVLSRPSVAIVTPKSEAAPDTPPEVRIHILSVGTSDYLGDSMDLNYAAADARAFAAAMEVAAREFVCPQGDCGDLVQVTTLLADHAGSPDPSTRPTRTNILRELNAIADRAGPEDIVIVFFAGHGVTTNATRPDTIDGRSVNTSSESYLYLTPEAGVMAPDALAGLAGQHATVSGAEIAQALARSKARKQLLILDTCGAAGASTSIGATRSMSGSHLRELDRTASRSGVWLLAGSAADAVSYEASDFGQGVLTYALLEGLLGPGLRDDDYVEITNWLNHANEAVPRLARGIGGIQRPQLIPGFRELDPTAPLRSNAQEGSFAVGRLPAEVRAGITLPSPRPVVIRSQLADSRFNRDTLGVSKALDALLQEADLEGHIRFWATDEAADRLTITGVYTRTATGVEVRAQILRLTSPEPMVVGEMLVFTVTAPDQAATASQIASRLQTVMLDLVASGHSNQEMP